MQPTPANPAQKAAGIAWVSTLGAEGWTCLEGAGVMTVNIANQSSKSSKRILVLGDGLPYCGGDDTSAACLTSITAANYQSIPIDTLFISAAADGIAFMQQLAVLNNGAAYVIP